MAMGNGLRLRIRRHFGEIKPVSLQNFTQNISIIIFSLKYLSQMLIKSTLWLAAEHHRILLITTSSPHRFASSGGGGHEEDVKMEKQPDFYRPGSDSYAYENPWPKLNKGRFDWMFKDGWRRPLAEDQGGYIRRQWIWLTTYSYDEYKDWRKYHKYMFMLTSVTAMWFAFWFLIFVFPDWPIGKDWAYREAHFELERRRRAGLPIISPDLIERSRVEADLPSDEELRDFDIII